MSPARRSRSEEFQWPQQVATLLERVEGQLKAVSEGHDLLNQKIDSEVRQLREEMRQGFSTVERAIQQLQQETKQLQQETKQLQQETKQLQQETKQLQQAVSTNSDDLRGLRREVQTLTERFEEHLKVHAT